MAAARAGPRTRSFARPAPAPSLLQERVREMTAEATGTMQGYTYTGHSRGTLDIALVITPSRHTCTHLHKTCLQQQGFTTQFWLVNA